MRLHIIKTLFLKEIKEVVRDKNQLFLMILMPFFMYPFLFLGISQISSVQSNKLKQKEVKIWVESTVVETPLYEWLESKEQYQLETATVYTDTLKEAIAITLSSDYQQLMDKNAAAKFQLYYDSNSDAVGLAANDIKEKIAALNEKVVAQRLEMAQLNEEFVTPLTVEKIDVAATGSMGSYWMKMIPGYVIFLIFLGIIYTAIDTTAGEKERKTLQNIYVAPLKTSEIIAGKFAAVFSVGLLSGLANMGSLLMSLIWIGAQSSSLSSFIPTTVTFSGWLWLICLLLLVTAIIASVSLTVLLQANTYKEAQGYITPLMLLLFVPIGLTAIMELDLSTMCLPFINILLAMTAILKGTADANMLFMVVVTSLVYSGLALYSASLIFGNESVITGQRVNYRQLLQRGGKSNKRIFGVKEALLFMAVVMLAFLMLGVPLQMKLPIWAGILSSFTLVLGGLSIAAIYYYGLHNNLAENLHLKRPTWRATLATLLLVPSTFVIASFIYSLTGTVEHSSEFMNAIQPLMDMNTFLGVIFIALCPAIFEELVCRGVLFRGLKNEWGKWAVILVSAVLFGLMHFDFYRLATTTFVGIILGYILWQSNSIYLSSLFHFCYNAMAYILMKYWAIGTEIQDFESVPLIWVLAATAVMGIGIWLLGTEKAEAEQPILAGT